MVGMGVCRRAIEQDTVDHSVEQYGPLGHGYLGNAEHSLGGCPGARRLRPEAFYPPVALCDPWIIPITILDIIDLMVLG